MTIKPINPIGPINEVIVTITNIILRSPYGKTFFPDTEAGQELFGEWQGKLMDTSVKIYSHWNESNLSVEYLLTKLEKTLEEVFPPIQNTESKS